MKRRGRKPQKKVSIDWSPNLAYAVGLIATDGCLSSDGRHIDFTSKDRQLVATFADCLKIKNKIATKASGSSGKQSAYHIQFGDIHFYRWLLRVGLTPRKSKTIGALQISKRYFRDFLRGCFDGDGTIYAYWDRRWPNSYMYYLQVSSASIPFLQWLQKNILDLTGENGRIQPAGRCFQLVFAKKATRAIFDKMFYSRAVPHLERKRRRADQIFTTEGRHK